MNYKCKLIKHSETTNEKIDRFFRNRLNGQFIVIFVDGIMCLHAQDRSSYYPDLYTSSVVNSIINDKTMIITTKNTTYEFQILEKKEIII